MQSHFLLSKGNVLIIGAGPAGIAASVQLRLCGFSPILIDKDEPGGLIRCAQLVRNYPGFPEGIKGAELASLLKKHIEAFEIDLRKMFVKEVSERDQAFEVKTDKGTIHAEFLVVASGTTPIAIPPDIKLTYSRSNPEVFSTIAYERCEEASGCLETNSFSGSLQQSRVFYDIRPLLQLLTGETKRNVLIFGAGDLAFDYALTLEEFGARPKIIIRKCSPRAEEHLKHAVSKAGIRITTDFPVQSIDVLEDLVQVSGPNGTITGDYILISIGRKPCIDILSPKLYESYRNGIPVKGLQFAGDVKRGPFRQTAIACGDGVLAAMHLTLGARKNVHA